MPNTTGALDETVDAKVLIHFLASLRERDFSARMPLERSQSLAEELRESNEDLELKAAIVDGPALTTRVVVITGLGRHSELDATEAYGVSATLSTPVHREDVRACLRVALGLTPHSIVEQVRDTGSVAARRPDRGRLCSTGTRPPPASVPRRASFATPRSSP